jgi:hypothetical protein
LPERAICFDPEEKGLSDPFVRIEMDGKELHFDKAKYDSSKALGVKRDQDGRYFLDRIELAAS